MEPVSNFIVDKFPPGTQIQNFALWQSLREDIPLLSVDIKTRGKVNVRSPALNFHTEHILAALGKSPLRHISLMGHATRSDEVITSG